MSCRARKEGANGNRVSPFLSLRRRSRWGASRRAPRPAARAPRRSEPLEDEASAGGGCEEALLHLGERREHDELLLERPWKAPAAEVPAVELLQEAERALLAELAHRLAHEEQQLGDDLLARGLTVVADDLGERPGIALRGTADHHRGRTGRREHGLRTRSRVDVARGDHRDVDQRDELGGQRMVRGAGVHLLGRARVQGQRGGARTDQPRADDQARPRAVLDASPHLHRYRQRRRPGDCLDEPAGVIGVVEQRRARTGLRHLLDGAAEVDVDDVRARGLDHPRGLGHRGRVRAEDLDRQRVLVRAHAQVAEGLLVPVPDPGHRDHLRAHEAGPVPAALPAKGLHRDARHRRQDDPAGDLDSADPPGVCQVDVHGREG